MKWILCCAIGLIVNVSSPAQNAFIDSIEVASSYDGPKELGEIFRRKGIAFKNKGAYAKAAQCYNESLRIYTDLDDSASIGNVLNNLGLLYFTRSDNTQALAYYYESVSVNEKAGNNSGLINNYLNLGNFFYYQEDFSQSLKYFFLCKEHLANSRNLKMLALIHTGIGNILSHKDYEQKNIINAQEEYLSALILYQEVKDSLSVSRIYNNLGIISYTQGKYTEAINYHTKGLLTKEKLNDLKGMSISYLNIGNALKEQQRYQESLANYEKGKAIAEQLRDGVNYLHIISNIVNVHMALGNVEEAALLFQEYNVLNDSIYTEEKSRQLTELQTAYETEKTAKELEQQKIATEEKTALNRVLSFVIISLFGLVIMVVVLFLQRQKAKKHLRAKEDELHRQEVWRLQKDQDIQSLQAMMNGQEQERKRIAEDLHDRLGAKLSAIKLFHESSHTDTSKFDKVDEMLNETIIETREIAHNLAPSVLTKYGLLQALQDLLETLQSTKKLEVQFSHTNLEERLPASIETALYYIVQELVTNTLRHSEADMISISLLCHEDGMLNLCYEDNGKGFDPAGLPEDSMGLRNMKTRLAPFFGKLSIDAAPNHGATFIIDIALDQVKV
jgi:signal transduction histidine kinase